MTLRAAIVEKRFGANRVLSDIGLEVAPGEVLAILGPSGVGKTTLLRILAGLDTAFEGSVEAPARRAMVFQEPTLLPWRDALHNLTLTTRIGAAEAQRSLARVGLAGKAGHFPRQLSLGQQRRLALARAYAARPQLLLLDEPFVSLDAELVADMVALTRDLIAELKPATVFVTHSAQEAQALATRTLRLER